MEIVKFDIKDKNQLIELDKECFGVNNWDNELWNKILGEKQELQTTRCKKYSVILISEI